MNYKTMRGLLALGIKVRHESWEDYKYLYRDSSECLMHIGVGYIPLKVNAELYNPDSSIGSSIYIAKYAKGWEVYDESKSQ